MCSSAPTNYACAEHYLTCFRFTLQARDARQAVRPRRDTNTKDTQGQHLGLVVERDHFSLEPLAQAGEARDMAPDAEILPRSRSRHLLRQEDTGAPVSYVNRRGDVGGRIWAWWRTSC